MAQISVSHATTQSSYLQTAILTTCCYWLMARLCMHNDRSVSTTCAHPMRWSLAIVDRCCAAGVSGLYATLLSWGRLRIGIVRQIYTNIYLSKVEIDIFSDLMRRPHVQRVVSSQSRLNTFQSPKSVVKPVCWCWCGSAVYGHANDAFLVCRN